VSEKVGAPTYTARKIGERVSIEIAPAAAAKLAACL
jgi:hypothetical protein